MTIQITSLQTVLRYSAKKWIDTGRDYSLHAFYFMPEWDLCRVPVTISLGDLTDLICERIT
jgi:hypothetical protein